MKKLYPKENKEENKDIYKNIFYPNVFFPPNNANVLEKFLKTLRQTSDATVTNKLTPKGTIHYKFERNPDLFREEYDALFSQYRELIDLWRCHGADGFSYTWQESKENQEEEHIAKDGEFQNEIEEEDFSKDWVAFFDEKVQPHPHSQVATTTSVFVKDYLSEIQKMTKKQQYQVEKEKSEEDSEDIIIPTQLLKEWNLFEKEPSTRYKGLLDALHTTS